MPGVTEAGENKAWSILETLEPDEVCRRAAVSFDPASGAYLFPSFGMDFSVSPRDRSIASRTKGGETVLQLLGDFFRLSVRWHLVNARDVPCTGRLVNLQYVKGGEIFTRGSHLLPLERLAIKYGRNREGFILKGEDLGGERVSMADAAVRLYPFPRVPVVLTLWLADDEFPARADLLLDSTCELQLPTDIIWSVAMMSVLIML